jgi:hypothetical protein
VLESGWHNAHPQELSAQTDLQILCTANHYVDVAART